MSSETLSTRLQRIAQQAVNRQWVFTNLAHQIDVELLREAFRLIRKDGAPGVDGQTAAEYAKDLESNPESSSGQALEDLHERLKSLKYRATPALRAWIPKEDGRQRPIAILTVCS